MAEYVTFIGKDSDGNVLNVISVTAYLGQQFALQEQFGPGQPGVGPNVVALAPGVYTVTARSDGFIFPFNQIVTLVAGVGPDPNNPFTVELVGTSSVNPNLTATPVRVYGWVPQPSANSAAGQPLQSHGQSYSDGPNMHAVTVSPNVWLELISSQVSGEMRNLAQVSRTRVSPDRHGYWEAYLVPNSVYRVALPAVHGVRYLKTPASGEAEVETLIDAARHTPLYKLV